MLSADAGTIENQRTECSHSLQILAPVTPSLRTSLCPADGLVYFYKAVLSNLVTPSTLHTLHERSWFSSLWF